MSRRGRADRGNRPPGSSGGNSPRAWLLRDRRRLAIALVVGVVVGVGVVSGRHAGLRAWIIVAVTTVVSVVVTLAMLRRLAPAQNDARLADVRRSDRGELNSAISRHEPSADAARRRQETALAEQLVGSLQVLQISTGVLTLIQILRVVGDRTAPGRVFDLSLLALMAVSLVLIIRRRRHAKQYLRVAATPQLPN